MKNRNSTTAGEGEFSLPQHCADIAGNSKPILTQIKQLGRQGKQTRA